MDKQLSGNKVLTDGTRPIDDAIVEVSVLLETCQLASLESAAAAQGLTAAALVRCLLRDYLVSFEDHLQASCPGIDVPEPMDASICFPAECRDI